MKIVQIVAGLEPGGGMAESVPRLCQHLARLGHEVTLVTLAGPVSDAAREAVAEGVRLVQYERSWPRFLFFSRQMVRGLRGVCAGAEVVHVHSNWTFPVWWGGRCALKEKKLLVMAPRGCFDPVRLRHKRWKKRLVGWIDRWLLRRADVVHVTSEMEAEWMAGRHGRPAGVNAGRTTLMVVANGVSPCQGKALPGAERPGVRRVVYMGRNHPLKGLDMLVEAWRVLQGGARQYSEVSVRCADGSQCSVFSVQCADHCKHPASGSAGSGEIKKGELASENRLVYGGSEWELRLYGPGLPEGVAEGEEKWRVLREADLVVLPTRSENFGLVVAEALAVGTPVITTKGAPWAELLGDKAVSSQQSAVSGDQECGNSLMRECLNGEILTQRRRDAEQQMTAASHLPAAISTGRCGWWIEIGVEPLAAALREAMGLSDEERRAMGENGRRLVERKYMWEAVARQMAAVYEAARAPL